MVFYVFIIEFGLRASQCDTVFLWRIQKLWCDGQTLCFTDATICNLRTIINGIFLMLWLFIYNILTLIMYSQLDDGDILIMITIFAFCCYSGKMLSTFLIKCVKENFMQEHFNVVQHDK